MVCPLSQQCGGCSFQYQDEVEYRRQKYAVFQKVINRINQQNIIYGEPIFIPIGTRRRASMAFSYIKKQLKLGFNVKQSHDIADCHNCELLTTRLNNNLKNIRMFLQELCSEPYSYKKGKKNISKFIDGGDVFLCDADNGIDIIIELPFNPELGHRMIISEQINLCPDIIRVSWRKSPSDKVETIIEKIKPIIKNSGIEVYIPAGTFLQASKEGEQSLIDLVLKYIGDKRGNIADLFCGVGTFSYPLSGNKKNQILSIDSSQELLDGFRQSVNKNQIKNINIISKNLFKYPLDEQELKKIDVVIFDPPRAGASSQVTEIIKSSQQPSIIIAVSCNPYTFVNDANILISGGYTLKEITMVDQFIYSTHTELVALFEKEQ